MKDQHEKIKGYRSLTQEEIDLMNEIKQKGAEIGELHKRLVEKLNKDYDEKSNAVFTDECPFITDDNEAVAEHDRFNRAEPLRWANIGKTDIQTGIMALVRAVAQPNDGF